MKPDSDKLFRLWNYDQAASTITYIRPLLAECRECYIRVWHLYRKNRYSSKVGPHRRKLKKAGDRGRAALTEINKIGILVYYSPLRGIALFPILVHCDGGIKREAYFVYKDSRDTIDSFIFNDELCEFADLYGWERPVPEEWKRVGAIPKLNRETKP